MVLTGLKATLKMNSAASVSVAEFWYNRRPSQPYEAEGCKEGGDGVKDRQ